MTQLLTLLLLTTLSISTTSCTSGPFRKKMTFTGADLQKKIAPKFPLKKKNTLFTVTFSQPLILLEKGADRLGIRLDLKVAPPFGKKYKGTVEVDGKIAYHPDQGEFVVVDPQVRQLHIGDVPQKYQGTIRDLMNQVAIHYLTNIPVYKLDQGDFKQSLAKLVLRSVLIEDGELVIEMGL